MTSLLRLQLVVWLLVTIQPPPLHRKTSVLGLLKLLQLGVVVEGVAQCVVMIGAVESRHMFMLLIADADSVIESGKMTVEAGDARINCAI